MILADLALGNGWTRKTTGGPIVDDDMNVFKFFLE